jgi:Cdc6-like AAA superfamily ATPase
MAQTKQKKPKLSQILTDSIFRPLLRVTISADGTKSDTLTAVSQLRQDAREFMQDVIDGDKASVMIYGSPGTGKTTLVQSALEENGYVKGQDYLVARSHITSKQLYYALWHSRQKGKFLLLDDCDTVFTEERSLNLLKSATDETFREIRWDSSQGLVDGNGDEIPCSFEFNGTVIITTNITPNTGKGRMAQHLKAIRSRCEPFELTAKNNMDAYAHVFHLVYEKDMLHSQFPDVNWNKKIDLLKFLLKNIDHCTALDLRKPGHIIKTMLKHPKNWQRKALRLLKTA